MGAKEQSGRTWSSLYLNSRDKNEMKICKLLIQPLFDEINVCIECIVVNFGCGMNFIGTQKTYIS